MTTAEQAFLNLIGFAEVTSTAPYTKNDGYDVIVMGADMKPETFTDYSHHPFEDRPAKLIVLPGVRFHNGLKSSASGKYQIIISTWHDLAHKLSLSDFSPASQDAAALELLRAHDILEELANGSIIGAIEKAGAVWASFPSSTAGQGGKSLSTLLAEWLKLTKESA